MKIKDELSAHFHCMSLGICYEHHDFYIRISLIKKVDGKDEPDDKYPGYEFTSCNEMGNRYTENLKYRKGRKK